MLLAVSSEMEDDTAHAVPRPDESTTCRMFAEAMLDVSATYSDDGDSNTNVHGSPMFARTVPPGQ